MDTSANLFMLLVAIPLLPMAALFVVRGKALRRSATHVSQLARYVSTLVLQHVTVAATVSVAACVLPDFAWVGGLVVAIYSALLALDVSMVLGSGFRFEPRMMKLLLNLREMAVGKPVKRWAVVFVAWVVLTFLLGVRYWSSASALHASSCVLLAAVAAILSQVMSKGLPVALQHGWDNVVFSFALTVVRRARRGAGARKAEASTLPSWLLSRHEVACPVDPNYPLFRETTAFTGDTHFTLETASSERPHVVLLMLESFAARDVGVLGARYNVTPNFDALAKEGVLWSNYHANGTLTSRSAMALLYGIIAPFTEGELRNEAPARLRGLPQIMRDAGYLTASMESGTGAWEQTREFNLGRGGFAQVFCQYVFRLLSPGTPFGGFSFDDRHMLDFHVQWMKKHDDAGMPTFTHLSTTTNHHPFIAPAGAAMPEHDLPADSTYAKALRTMLYTDKCIGDYMAKMRAAGLDKKTIFLIMGDHGNIVVDDGSGRMVSGAPFLQVSHVPLLLLAPGRIRTPKVVGEVASHVDVMPTILDMLNMRAKHHGVGTSLRRVCSTRHAVITHQFMPRFAITRFDNMRHWYAFGTEHAGLFNVDADPREAHDIQAEHAALVKQYTRDVIAMRETMDVLFKEDRMCPPSAVQHETVSVVGAPWFVPRDVQHLAEILPQLHAPTPAEGDGSFAREREVMAIVASMNASPDVVVTSMQILFKYLRPAELGMLTDAQTTLVESLLQIVSQHPRGTALLDAGVADREVA